METDGGEVTGAAVVVATDPPAAAALTGEPTPPMKALTTFWHTAPEPPTTARLLHLDADARGPVINTAVLTTAAPTYAPAGRPLIATTVLGADGSSEAERVARAHAGVIYGVYTDSWELVTTHVVAGALPAQPPPLRGAAAGPAGLRGVRLRRPPRHRLHPGGAGVRPPGRSGGAHRSRCRGSAVRLGAP